VGGMTAVSDVERGWREVEATGGLAPEMWAAHGVPAGRFHLVRLIFAWIGGDPMDDLSRDDLKAAINETLAELRGAVAAVGWNAGVAVWANTKPEPADAVMEQRRYPTAVDERDAA